MIEIASSQNVDRLDLSVVRSQRENLLYPPYLEEVLKALPYLAFIINKERQLLMANKRFRNMLST